MNMNRNGKIARMALEDREQLNVLIRDGEQGTGLLDWVNARPSVKKLLDAEFSGKPITKQNLSEWRQGGYRDWLRNQEAHAWLRGRMEAGQTTGGGRLMASEMQGQLACVASVELALMMKELVNLIII